jgi:ferredoxin
VQVHLDAATCQGHNRCRSLAPDLFDVEKLGQALLRLDGELPTELTRAARLAALNCPEFAISITDRLETIR